MRKNILLLFWVAFSLFCLSGRPLQAITLDFLKGEGEHDAYHAATQDSRPLKQQVEDDSLEANVKKGLAPIAHSGTKISVYSFYGHIYIVGEMDAAFATSATQKARETEGVHDVTAVSYAPHTASLADDARIKTDLQKILLASSEHSTRIYVEVWGGSVLLLGVVKSMPDLKSIGAISGVKGVTSLLQLERQTSK